LNQGPAISTSDDKDDKQEQPPPMLSNCLIGDSLSWQLPTGENLMGLFEKLFGGRENRQFKRSLRESKVHIKEVYEPLGRLNLAVVRAAHTSFCELASLHTFDTVEQRDRTQYPISCELVYGFSHLALRSAINYGFTREQIQKICAYHDPLLTTTMIDSFCGNWPQDVKDKLAHEFLNHLNNAHSEYAECSLESKDHSPSDPQFLHARLADHIMQLCNRSTDIHLKPKVVEITIDARHNMELNAILADMAAVIDSASAEFFPFFWTGSEGKKKAS
jgi:hypothetical protein